MNAQTINKLLTALNECTEWGQVKRKQEYVHFLKFQTVSVKTKI
jgi:hypothetical protein